MFFPTAKPAVSWGIGALPWDLGVYEASVIAGAVLRSCSAYVRASTAFPPVSGGLSKACTSMVHCIRQVVPIHFHIMADCCVILRRGSIKDRDLFMHICRPYQVSYTSRALVLPSASETHTLDICEPDASPLIGLNLIVVPFRLNVPLSHASPPITRRINICGDMHYGKSRSIQRVLHVEHVAEPRTIMWTYTQMNVTNVGLPTPNDTKNAMPESVYGSTDSMTIVTTAKYIDAYSCPRRSWTVLPCRITR